MRTQRAISLLVCFLFCIAVWVAVYVVSVEVAGAHYYAGCKKERCMAHVVKPHKAKLRARALCESGGDPRAHDPSGWYHGLYQFDWRSWLAAGGRPYYSDPHDASPLEQSYRALIWEKRHGGDPWPNCP